jgi:hypothetical protein
MMSNSDILARLRRIYVDGIRDWDDNYEAYIADVERRIGCLSVELAKSVGSAVTMETPTGDVHYYSLEAPVSGPPGRFRISAEDVAACGREAIYLVAYCSSILPVVELRWHVMGLDAQQNVIRKSYDVLDDVWLSTHPREAEFSLAAVDAAERCGWQVIGPDLTEQPAPKEWPYPLPSYDYQDGAYLVRDYMIKGMRDY